MKADTTFYFQQNKSQWKKATEMTNLRGLHDLYRDILTDNQKNRQNKICQSIWPPKGRMTILWIRENKNKNQKDTASVIDDIITELT